MKSVASGASSQGGCGLILLCHKKQVLFNPNSKRAGRWLITSLAASERERERCINDPLTSKRLIFQMMLARCKPRPAFSLCAAAVGTTWSADVMSSRCYIHTHSSSFQSRHHALLHVGMKSRQCIKHRPSVVRSLARVLKVIWFERSMQTDGAIIELILLFLDFRCYCCDGSSHGQSRLHRKLVRGDALCWVTC